MARLNTSFASISTARPTTPRRPITYDGADDDETQVSHDPESPSVRYLSSTVQSLQPTNAKTLKPAGNQNNIDPLLRTPRTRPSPERALHRVNNRAGQQVRVSKQGQRTKERRPVAVDGLAPQFKKQEELERRSFLLCFNDLQKREIIEATFEHWDNIDPAVRERAEKKVGTDFSNWKSRCLKDMRQYVTDAIARNDLIKTVSDQRALTKHFYDNYDISQFEYCFNFVKKAISIGGSTKRGQAYCRNIFAVLAAKVKLNLDWKNDSQALRVDSRDDASLSFFFDNMASAEEFENIEPDDFQAHVPTRASANARRPHSDLSRPSETEGWKLHNTEDLN
ncbi:MAG: hypothetical protein M1820_010213 [Bogoriella megaspora]|nr:MAG: hypothetical protein M1820_010213 [Bogoriella megaspora]